jgi:hypothetical protein
MVTEAELNQLVESLELAKLRMKDSSPSINPTEIDAMHRQFHYHVVRWVQDVAGLLGK